jgi:hypothetical protein
MMPSRFPEFKLEDVRQHLTEAREAQKNLEKMIRTIEMENLQREKEQRIKKHLRVAYPTQDGYELRIRHNDGFFGSSSEFCEYAHGFDDPVQYDFEVELWKKQEKIAWFRLHQSYEETKVSRKVILTENQTCHHYVNKSIFSDSKIKSLFLSCVKSPEDPAVSYIKASYSSDHTKCFLD